MFGSVIDCGGGYVLNEPGAVPHNTGPSHHPSSAGHSSHPTTTTAPGGSTPSVVVIDIPNPWQPGCLMPVWVPAGSVAGLNGAAPSPSNTAPACPAPVPPPPGAPALDPATLAEQFWQVIPLPKPRPSIPPGFAITGKPAYLVTDGTTAPQSYAEDTPLGRLELTARGAYYVSWGDGDPAFWDGPYRTEGQPYPDGTIAHTYDDVGTVTVRVREAWTATWQLGPASGTLRGLATDASIPGFRVEQVQAVITS